MSRVTWPVLVLVLALGCFSTSLAQAEEDRCYRIPMPGNPAASIYAPNSELWCYRAHWSPVGSVFVFNADEAEAKPELAFIDDPDGTLTHASLQKGRLSIHRVKDFIPFSVPREEPLNLVREVAPSDARFLESVAEVERLFSSSAASTAALRIEPGTFSGSVATSALPFRGYWWAYRGFPMSDPMRKFDVFAKARGKAARAHEWEAREHKYHGTNWSGHCNGWAASAVLRDEPKTAKYDALSDVLFSVTDQKALLSELDYCVSYSFHGRRYPNGSLYDVTPRDFHNVLTYNIGTLGRPVAVDVQRTNGVTNNVYSAYRTTVVKIGTNHFRVTTDMRNHIYDSGLVQTPGIAPSVWKRFRYTLRTDTNGNILSGQWESTNPDFLWVPLSPRACDHENPYVTSSLVDAIANLPAVAQ